MHLRRPLLLLAAALALADAVAPAPASGQARHPLEEARSLREAGQTRAAAEVVRRYLSGEPGDAGARWLLAQLLRSLGDSPAAHAEYERALALTPDDRWLRLDYAGALLESGDLARASEVALPVTTSDDPHARAEAETILGTAAYWRGDLLSASRRFERALGARSDQPEAARQLAEIRAGAAPWVRLGIDLLDDNQPYTRAGAPLEAGLFLNPLWALSAEVTPGRAEGFASATIVGASAGVRGYVPAARLDLAVRAGTHWDSGLGGAGVGNAEAGVRLPVGTALRFGVARERYLGTATSVDTLLLFDRLELRLDRAAAPGWAGEAVVRGERFPDGNTIRTAYAWVLAPILPVIRAGYAAAWQDADASTWRLEPGARPGPPGLGGAGGAPLPGIYDPYYTPRELTTHSLLGELLVGSASTVLRLSGAYGIHATEQAPQLQAGAGNQPPQLGFAERSFNPWRLTAALDLPAGERLAVRVVAEREATAFYRVTRLGASMLYRLNRPR